MAGVPIELFRVFVTGLEEISPSVFLLHIEKLHPFVPGQVVALTISEGIHWRLYSIASGTGDKHIRILFKVVAGGELTASLAALKIGDTVLVSRPFGSFRGDVSQAFWIATGTGIAPFISMYLSGLGKNKILVHGGRSSSSFYFENEFNALGNNYIRCCSGSKGEGLYYGRVTAYLKSIEKLPENHNYYLCGSTEMVNDVRGILLERTIAFNRIFAEIYF